jgi:hypothetical protein
MSQSPSIDASVKPFWKGTNFYVLALALIGSTVGLTMHDSQAVVANAIGIGSVIFAVREYVGSKAFDLKAWILDRNTWAYAGSLLALLLPTAPAGSAEGLTEAAGTAVNAAASGNYALLAQAAFSIISILWHWLSPTRGK